MEYQKLSLHPKRVAEWMNNGDCYPVYMEIGTTNMCNHRCIFCALDYLNYGKEFINPESTVKALREMGGRGVKAVMFAGEGEPLLHKNIGLFVRTAKESNMEVSITTNGVPLDKNKIEECLPYLSWIRFSVDSGSPENYAKIHHTSVRDYEIVMRNITNSVKFRDNHGYETDIDVQFLMIPENMEEESIKLTKRVKDIGVNRIQIKPYSQHPKSLNKANIDFKKYNSLEKELKKFESDEFEVWFRRATAEMIEEGITYKECYGNPFFALIEATGNIIPCNIFYGEEEFSYGNINNQTFGEIWLGKKRKEILRRLKEKGIENCRVGCRLDAINRYLDRIKNPKKGDNFI